MFAMNHTKYLTAKESALVEETLAKYRDDRVTLNFRDVLMLDVLIATGARCSEMLAIRQCDLDAQDQTVFLTGLKGSRSRTIPIPADLFSRLASHAVSLPPQEKLFKVTYKRLQQIWDMYRPINKPLHALRHTFAIRLYKRSKDIRLVQRALGHRYISTTMIYADYAYSVDEMSKYLR